ncbi:MAG: radical SAM protein [Christensenellaceae bacterium]|nr:radical SAM protein [Christensenellaceae bacterium]
MDQIVRKTLLYKTDVEYGYYTINHVLGCSHGCMYPCYAMLMSMRFGKVKNYESWIKPCVVSNALELLDKELQNEKLVSKIKEVHLCFTTDPFMYNRDDIRDMSLEIIKRLNLAKLKCTALTKGILPIELASLSKENEYGITLISLDESFRQKIESGSAPYKDRIDALKDLHDSSFKTWVSIEPYPTPNFIEQNINEILESLQFVDKIIFGRLNYNSKVCEYKDYRNFFNRTAQQVIEFCDKHNIKYHIKNGTITDSVQIKQ